MAIAPNQTANRFELQCDDVQVTYSTSSFAGPPGAAQSYEAVALHGVAQSVAF